MTMFEKCKIFTRTHPVNAQIAHPQVFQSRNDQQKVSNFDPLTKLSSHDRPWSLEYKRCLSVQCSAP